MRKNMASLLLLILCLLLLIQVFSDVKRGAHAAQYSEEEIQLMYDPDINYLELAHEALDEGNAELAEKYLNKRNTKISDLNLEYDILTMDSIIQTHIMDYDARVVDALAAGTYADARSLCDTRNQLIEVLGSSSPIVVYDDFYLLSKIITWEAGSSWLTEDHRMMVGEVLLNRVESPEFPNSLEECVYQRGQYHDVTGKKFQSLAPNKVSIRAAWNLLCGERIINDPAVVFQSGNKNNGSSVYLKIEDEILGTTYFCYSNHMELYE